MNISVELSLKCLNKDFLPPCLIDVLIAKRKLIFLSVLKHTTCTDCILLYIMQELNTPNGVDPIVNSTSALQNTAIFIPEDEFPPYPLPPTPAYTTPGFVVNFQKFRDQMHIRELFVEAVSCFLFTILIILPAGGLVFTQGVQGSFLIAILCVSFSVMFSIYISVLHSGAILSPAMLLCYALFRGFPWKKVPFYLVAHFLGSFVAGVIAYGLMDPWMDAVDHGNRMAIPLGPTSTAAVFVPMPPLFLPPGHLFLNEFLGDVIFAFMVMGLLDSRNKLIDVRFLPVLISLVVFVVAGAFGWYGFVLNPFRDFGPRVYLSHYYNGIFSYNNYYSMIALFAPVAGHIVGVLLYDFMVSSRYTKQVKA
eukprot:Phypoly_transcript_10924.p1 GENE.Phypoly_transcript_10924~~Phypoly_transcript_10924.p1  ORF type:complete len:364 (+),score=39.66 Phypoly_transcript_10924:137-1228(+)